MTMRGNTSQAVSNHPSQIYNNKYDAEGKHVSSCQQSSVTDLQQQITALVETVAQLSFNMATLNKKVDERVPTDQNIGGSQHQFDRAYEQRGEQQQIGRGCKQAPTARTSDGRFDACTLFIVISDL